MLFYQYLPSHLHWLRDTAIGVWAIFFKKKLKMINFNLYVLLICGKEIALVRFLLLLLFRLTVDKLCILFGPHCNISAYTQDYELKFGIQMNFDTLISNLKSYFQYEIVMTSL